MARAYLRIDTPLLAFLKDGPRSRRDIVHAMEALGFNPTTAASAIDRLAFQQIVGTEKVRALPDDRFELIR